MCTCSVSVCASMRVCNVCSVHTCVRACVCVCVCVRARAVCVYMHSANVPFRFNRLFKVRERWTQEDLEPYIR